MTEETREKIIKWIFDNHNHHSGAEHSSMPLVDDAEFEHFEDESTCPDGDSPYVNSLELEKFIKELA